MKNAIQRAKLSGTPLATSLWEETINERYLHMVFKLTVDSSNRYAIHIHMKLILSV